MSAAPRSPAAPSLRPLEHRVDTGESLIRIAQMPERQRLPRAAHDQRVLHSRNLSRSGATDRKDMGRSARSSREVAMPEERLAEGPMDVGCQRRIIEPPAQSRDLVAELRGLAHIRPGDEEMPENPQDLEQLRGLAHLPSERMGTTVRGLDLCRREAARPAQRVAEAHLEPQLQLVALLPIRQGTQQSSPLLAVSDRLDVGRALDRSRAGAPPVARAELGDLRAPCSGGRAARAAPRPSRESAPPAPRRSGRAAAGAGS